MDTAKIGRVAFIIGLVISVVAGFANLGELAIPALVILGIIVGLLNVSGEEVLTFLLATIALMLVGFTVGEIPYIGAVASTMLNHFVAFVAGAGLLVALREVFVVTKNA
ncbi:MAG: hypothetical protein KKA90_00185 [Nanoarchaeota archaeon]|nr:hypothetical protein [Nanoarchaeota archaeon]